MRHEKVYPDTELKVGDEVYYQGRWQEIYGFGESRTHLSWDGWTCRTKFQVEREVEMTEPIKVARELLNLTKEIHDHSDKQESLICDMSSLIEKQDEKIKVLETEIVGWKDQWHCDTARINQLSAAYAEKVTEIRELKKANSELASAAISKDEVLCEFVPYETRVNKGLVRDEVIFNGHNTVVKIYSNNFEFKSVEKVIELTEKEAYMVDENFSLFGKKKKEKWVTRYRTSRAVKVFETAPDRSREGVYKGYPRTEEFKGDNYDDMVANIEKYLTELMEEINRPLKDCPCCKGTGVVEVE